MNCEIQGQITMLKPVSNEPSTPIIGDIVCKDGEIFVSDQNYHSWNLPDWFPKDAWGKRLKDGDYVFHTFKVNDRPKNPRKNSSATLQDRKRRFFYKLMMDYGNLTCKDISDFKNWLDAYDQANTVEAVKEIICDKYCLICKKRKRNNHGNDDIGEDAVLLSVNGFKNDKRKAK